MMVGVKLLNNSAEFGGSTALFQSSFNQSFCNACQINDTDSSMDNYDNSFGIVGCKIEFD